MARTLIERLRGAERLVLLLDYDGTLVPFAGTPDAAEPDCELLELLSALSHRAQTEVHIVSGRDKDSLGRWFSGFPIGLHAEHGLWGRIAPEDDWHATREIPPRWKDPILPTIEEYTRKTPGSFIEHKTGSIAWHYRLANPAFGARQAQELRLHLDEVSNHSPVHVLLGEKVIEVKLRGVHKGQVVPRFVADSPQAILLAMGDDYTDEDLFAALPETGIAVHVGPNPSRAPYRLNDFRDARAFLRMISNGPGPDEQQP